MAHNVTQTPLMERYRNEKAKHPDAILLFRVGSFYETFSDDAIICSEILGITLTRRANGAKGQFTELAGFPYHALDNYLPKLIRAGKRVAIMEEAKETTKPQPKPNQTPKPMKRKDTIIENKKILDSEPIAWFTINIPKEAKDCGKCAANDSFRPAMTAVMVEPDSGKLVVTNTRILHTYDVECKGAWPQDRNAPFQCYIDAKSIANLAGKETEVAVFKAEVNKRKTELAFCEAIGVTTECDYKGAYPNWKAVIPQSEGWLVKLPESSIDELRKFIKPLIGKNKQERENRRVVLTSAKDGKTEISVYEADNSNSTELGEKLGEYSTNGESPINLKMMFNAELFYYAILPDFDGSIWVRDCKLSVKFTGELRETVLMPLYHPNGYCCESDEIETWEQRVEREEREERERKAREHDKKENNDEPAPF